MEIEKMMTLSTIHITESTSKYLDREDRAELVVYPKSEYGWFIYLGLDSLKDELLLIPKDLVEIIQFAIKNDCMWLCLDCDGDEEESLPIYEW